MAPPGLPAASLSAGPLEPRPPPKIAARGLRLPPEIECAADKGAAFECSVGGQCREPPGFLHEGGCCSIS